MAFELNLPPMRSNPFSGRPIESYDWNLLAGRGGIVAKMVRHLKYTSPRLILLKGERGSGRTSLIHALGSQASRFDSFSIFPYNDHSDKILEDTYTSIVGFDIPQHHGQVVSQLVEELNAMKGTLPLIAYDFPGASGADLVAVFSRLTTVLQRLRALIVITVTPSQLAAFPDELRDAFDDIEELGPLSTTAIEDLVKRRIDTVSRKPWSVPGGLIPALIEDTGGHTGRVVRYLRDIIDVERGEKNIDQRLLNLQSAMVENTISDITVEELDEGDELTIEQAIADNNLSSEDGHNEDEITLHEVDESEPEAVKSRIGTILEASPEPSSTFSLTMDRIEDEYESESSYLIDDTPSIPGIFGALAQRNRVAKNVIPRFDPELNPLPDHAFDTTPPTHTTEGAELWIQGDDNDIESDFDNAFPNPAVESPIEPNLSPTAHTRATGLSQQNHFNHVQQDAIHAHVGFPVLPVPPQVFEPQSLYQTNTIANRLGALRRQPQSNPHDSVPLNIGHLRGLSQHETEVIARASGGEFSPSDDDLLIRLNIGRSRMSQICNALYRSGIMRVRKVGRSRMYSLTNDARVQLQVWGILEG